MFSQDSPTSSSSSAGMTSEDEVEVQIKVEAEEESEQEQEEEVEKEIMQRVSQFLNEPDELSTNENDFDMEMSDLNFDLKEEKEWIDELDEMDQDSITNTNEITTTETKTITDSDFPSEFGLNMHEKHHNKKFKCTLCDLSFSRKNSLDCHLFSIHGIRMPNYKLLRCGLCSFETIKKSYLFNHIDAAHKTIKRFQCPQPHCNYQCTVRNSLKMHLLRVHSTHRPFKCPEPNCEYAGKERNTFKKHLKKGHKKSREEINTIWENLCSTSSDYAFFTSAVQIPKSQLEPSVNINTNDNRAIKFCNIKIQHGQKQKSKPGIQSCTIIPLYQCNNCDFYTKEHKELAIHLYSQHNLPRVGLQELPLIDLGPAPQRKEINHFFKCSEPNCEYKNTRKKYVQVHEYNQHGKKEEEDLQLFNCSFCSYKSPRPQDVKCHEDSVHKQIKDFECELCSFKASKKTNLQRHVDEKHLQNKNFSCDLCPKDSPYKTARSSDLQRHVNCKHLNIRPFKCPESGCEYAAKESRNLKSHMQKKHNMQP